MAYCNSCLKKIAKDDLDYCSQCGIPIHEKCANKCLTCDKILCDSCYAENNFMCSDCFNPENRFDVIRRSHIEQYAGCPYSLYLQLILGIEPPMNKYAQLGILVHALIDDIGNNKYTVETAKGELVDMVEKWNLNTDDEYSIITAELQDVGLLCLDNFGVLNSTLNQNYKSEYKIQYSINKDLPDISCTIDRISFDRNDVHVHDWKTGKPMSGKKLIQDLQPPLYIYAVYKEFGIMPKTFTLHYLQHNKNITYYLQNDGTYHIQTTRNTYVLDIQEALNRTEGILTGIKNEQFNMPQEATHMWRCKNFCWYGISGKCKGTQDEQWKLLNEKYAGDKK